MIVVGDAGAVLRSSDGGATWSAGAITSADLRGVASDPDAHVVLAVDASGGVWSSTDRGESFSTEATAPASLDAVAVSDDGSQAFAVGAAGTVLVRNSARAWSLVASRTRADLHAALISGGRSYAAGESGTLLGSDDGGRSWRARDLGTTAALYGMDDL